MKIFVTGGAGFLGAVLCEVLLDAGYEVTVLDNFRHKQPSLAHLLPNKNLILVRGDAREAKDLSPCIRDADIIIPLAALVGVDECEKDKTAARTTNVDAIELLWKMRHGKQRIIFPNTNSGYGTSGEFICTEDSPLMPISLYGKTKCQAENMVCNTPGHTVFRLATVFGMSPRMRWDLMVNNFVWRAVKDRCITLFEPHFRRNFVHVLDVARAFEWAIDNPDATKNQVFNLGDDQANMNKLQLCSAIQKHTELFVTTAHLAKDPDKRDYYVSSEKIKKAGFEIIRSLDDGIVELIKGAKQYG